MNIINKKRRELNRLLKQYESALKHGKTDNAERYKKKLDILEKEILELLEKREQVDRSKCYMNIN